jgi:hypothetical protein
MNASTIRRVVTGAAAVTVIASTSVALTASQASTPQVLRVGSWHGVAGNEPTLDAAIAALKPGGWLLIGPGDWHPQMDKSKAQAGVEYPSAMLITTPHVHIRGMNRNRVIIDGTKPGSAPCSKKKSRQDFGQKVHGVAQGRNGPEALHASDVWFENFTVCNFLTGSADTGNEIWWNGGDDGGKIGLGSWYGNYLTTTTTYFNKKKPDTAAQYGLFVSDSRGPGEMNHTYSSNFNDSAYYIGACRNCHAIINHGHAENSALGLSATNSGGSFIIENTEWDQNKAGMVSNSMNSGDPPPPQLGNCPKGKGKGPLGSGSCEIWRHNDIHNNNNPNVPYAGTAGFGPIGAGIVIAGTHNITLYKNKISHEKSWGVLTTIFPDTGKKAKHSPGNCHGGATGQTVVGFPVKCLFYTTDNIVQDNTFSHNGGFGNETNGDLADLALKPVHHPKEAGNCFLKNKDTGGTLTTWPAGLETSEGTCGKPNYPDESDFNALAIQAACAAHLLLPCSPNSPGMSYPGTTKVKLKPLHKQATMPNPCAGVPSNPWCPSGHSKGYVTASKPLLGGLGAPWPYGGIMALLAVGSIGWRRMHPKGRHART